MESSTYFVFTYIKKSVAAVQKHQLPSGFCSYQGTENILVAQYMLEKCGAERHSITGCSVHNQ